MENYIKLKEGFIFVYKKSCKSINIEGLAYKNIFMAKGWMEIVDFVAILESAQRNKLGTSKKYKIGDSTTIFGEYKKEFLVHININSEVLKFDLVEIQQLVSKLNKLLHVANKLCSARPVL